MPDLLSPRILVIRRRYLGDIVLLGSLLRNLRLHWPQAEITVLTDERFVGILSLNPDVNRALPYPAGGWLKMVSFWRTLRRAKFTYLLDLDCNDRSALVTWLSRAPVRSVLQIRKRLGWIYTHCVPIKRAAYENNHITETALGLLAVHQIPVVSREVKLVPHEEDLTALRRFVGATGPVLLVHPGSRSPARIWPVENFAAVCDRAQDELGVQVVLVGGPGEKNLVAEIRRLAQVHLLSVEEQSLPRLAALIQLSTVLLCHDSGPMHIAAAVGTPVVALFGSQSTVMWRPLGACHTVLQPSLPCGEACVAPGKCVSRDSYHSYCVRRIGVDEVFAAVRARLNAAASKEAGHE